VLPAPFPAASPLRYNPERYVSELQVPTTIKNCVLRAAVQPLSLSLLSSYVPWSRSVIGRTVWGDRGDRNLVEEWKVVAERKRQWGGKDKKAAPLRFHSKKKY